MPEAKGNAKDIDRHIHLPPELDERLVRYKDAKYNGLRAMNKVLVDCILIGLPVLEKAMRGKPEMATDDPLPPLGDDRPKRK